MPSSFRAEYLGLPTEDERGTYHLLSKTSRPPKAQDKRTGEFCLRRKSEYSLDAGARAKEWRIWGAEDSREQKQAPGGSDDVLCLRAGPRK